MVVQTAVTVGAKPMHDLSTIYCLCASDLLRGGVVVRHAWTEDVEGDRPLSRLISTEAGAFQAYTGYFNQHLETSSPGESAACNGGPPRSLGLAEKSQGKS